MIDNIPRLCVNLLSLQSLNLGSHGSIFGVSDANLFAQFRQTVRFEGLHTALRGRERRMGGPFLTKFGIIVIGITGRCRLGTGRSTYVGRRGVWRRFRSSGLIGRVITVCVGAADSAFAIVLWGGFGTPLLTIVAVIGVVVVVIGDG